MPDVVGSKWESIGEVVTSELWGISEAGTTHRHQRGVTGQNPESEGEGCFTI